MIGIVKNSMAANLLRRIAHQYPQLKVVHTTDGRFTTVSVTNYLAPGVATTLKRYVKQANAGLEVNQL